MCGFFPRETERENTYPNVVDDKSSFKGQSNVT